MLTVLFIVLKSELVVHNILYTMLFTINPQIIEAQGAFKTNIENGLAAVDACNQELMTAVTLPPLGTDSVSSHPEYSSSS